MYDTDPQLRTDIDGLLIESVAREVPRPRAHLEHGAQLVNGVRATFRLYYVMEQNVPSSAELVVVGFDTRKTGHYEYISVDPSIPWVDQLHARNKTVVKDWLRRHKGAEVAADRGIMARIAEPAEDAICQLLQQHAHGKVARGVLKKLNQTADPADSKQPASRMTESVDGSVGHGRHSASGTVSTTGPVRPSAAAAPVRRDGWTGLFECCYKDAGGRKRVQFVLRDTVTGRELAAVSGGETRPNSRRYQYCPIAALGGHTFSNRQQVLDWIYSEFQFAPNEYAAETPSDGGMALGGSTVPVPSVFGDARLAQWALSDPGSTLMRQLARAASALDALLPASTGSGAADEAAIQQAVKKVLCILEDLSQPRVGMQALDASRTVLSVRPYVGHPHAEIAQKAAGLIDTWRAQAQRTEALVQSALDCMPHAAG